MGFLDLFIERTETPSAPSATTGNSSIPKLPKTVSTPVTVSSAPVGNLSSEDLNKFNEHFDDLFNKANLPGPDYFEFSKMCQAMAALPDESKFPAVFLGLQVQGLTKEKLVESAKHYIAIIDEAFIKDLKILLKPS